MTLFKHFKEVQVAGVVAVPNGLRKQLDFLAAATSRTRLAITGAVMDANTKWTTLRTRIVDPGSARNLWPCTCLF